MPATSSAARPRPACSRRTRWSRNAHVAPKNLPPRSPVLCPGCPHRSTFYTLNKLKYVVAGDIGCYNLGALPPFNATDTMGAMGASVGVAHGFDKAGMPTSRWR